MPERASPISWSATLESSLLRLLAWRAVRPGSDWLAVPTEELEAQGLVVRVPTAIGTGLTVSVQARKRLGASPRETSEMVVASALYLQDAAPDLATAGFTTLRPGKGIFRVVTGPNGQAHPLLGRYTQRGYTRAYIQNMLERYEADFIAQGVVLVLVHPELHRFTLRHPRLCTVASAPHWES